MTTPDDRNPQTFNGNYDSTIKVALNFPPRRYKQSDQYVVDNHTYVSIAQPGRQRIYFAMSEDETRGLRDHLTALLGEDASAPALSERAVEAMEGLAHQMDVFYTSELSDALNRHADVMSKVHNL